MIFSVFLAFAFSIKVVSSCCNRYHRLQSKNCSSGTNPNSISHFDDGKLCLHVHCLVFMIEFCVVSFSWGVADLLWRAAYFSSLLLKGSSCMSHVLRGQEARKKRRRPHAMSRRVPQKNKHTSTEGSFSFSSFLVWRLVKALLIVSVAKQLQHCESERAHCPIIPSQAHAPRPLGPSPWFLVGIVANPMTAILAPYISFVANKKARK